MSHGFDPRRYLQRHGGAFHARPGGRPHGQHQAFNPAIWPQWSLGPSLTRQYGNFSTLSPTLLRAAGIDPMRHHYSRHRRNHR